MATKKRLSIYAALVANVLIAATKFTAGAFTNSSSMIAEGIHSLVDTINELLLLYGIHRSEKKPDKMHPFGYGKELYFWSFIVALLIFGLGGGLSVYQGVYHILHPQALSDAGWNYIVLGSSILFEGTSFIISLRAFNKVRGKTPLWQAIIQSKDPSRFLVLFEDGAAVAGLFVVLVFMRINQVYNAPVLDGVASVIVGLLLVFTSAVLARESRSLLIGEGITPEAKQQMTTLIEKDEAVERIALIFSDYQSPDTILLMLIIEFKKNLDISAITASIDRLRSEIKNRFELIEYIIIEPQTDNLERQLNKNLEE